MKFNYKNNMTSGMIKLIKNERPAVKKALGVTGLAILQDTIQQDPKPSFETGNLRGSQFMYVQGKKVNVATKSDNDAPASIDISAGSFTLEVGLNTPYAMAQHENLTPAGSWQPRSESLRGTPKDTTGVGGKFLEAKLSANKSRYAQIFAEVFSREWGKR
jgi:hypothetical protein